MKNQLHNFRGFIIFSATLLILMAVPLVFGARMTATSVNIVNNSSREIRSVYLSPVSVDDWSGNQLSAAIPAGQSRNLSNIACDQQQVKVIAEDQDGCFTSTVITCGDSATWTVTNETARDCGGN
jgi:hypothetical protein